MKANGVYQLIFRDGIINIFPYPKPRKPKSKKKGKKK